VLNHRTPLARARARSQPLPPRTRPSEVLRGGRGLVSGSPCFRHAGCARAHSSAPCLGTPVAPGARPARKSGAWECRRYSADAAGERAGERRLAPPAAEERSRKPARWSSARDGTGHSAAGAERAQAWSREASGSGARPRPFAGQARSPRQAAHTIIYLTELAICPHRYVGKRCCTEQLPVGALAAGPTQCAEVVWKEAGVGLD